MTSHVKNDAKKRLAKIAGQISGIQKMIDGERTCADVLQQINAVRAAVDQLGVVFLTEHLQTCVLHQGDPAQTEVCTELPLEKRSEEIRNTLTRFLK